MVALWIGELACSHVLCRRTMNSGRRRYEVASSVEEATAKFTEQYEQPWARRCGDCHRVIALRHLEVRKAD